jgi:hypothetical protein
MTTMSFELPESYRAYCGDAVVRTAVDHILSANSKAPLALPGDIEWKDLPAFHRAVLSAHQVRCEYAVCLIDLWDAVWQHALDKWEFKSSLVPETVSAAEEWWPHRLDTNTVWNERHFFRLFNLVSVNLGLGASIGIERVRLSVSLYGKDDTNHTTALDFSDAWPKQDIEHEIAWTGEDLVPIRDDGTIDLDPAREAAEGALVAVGAPVRG